MGGVVGMLSKLRSGIAKKYSSEEWRALAARSFNGLRFDFVPIDQSFPLSVRSNQEHFASWLGSDRQLSDLVAQLEAHHSKHSTLTSEV
jgi:hypothetical protein